MIIVAGHLRVAAADRDDFVARSSEAVRLARAAEGCLDFVVSADPLDPERVDVYERWTDREALHEFPGLAPGDDLGAMIVSADVAEFDVQTASGDAEG